MELLQLKYFCDTARTENFSKTAAKFRVPPSNISQSVKRLETELGVLLFERHANSIKLSDEGSLFYEKVSEALNLIDEGTAALNPTSCAGRIKILAASVRRIVMQAVERFKHAYPDVEIELNNDVRADIKDFDVVISGDDLTQILGVGETLLNERMMVAINKENPLSLKESISADDIKNESFVSMSKDSSLSRTCERIFAGEGFSPNVSIRCDDPYYVRKCVDLSLGIAIFPEVSWRGLFSSDTVLKYFGNYTRQTHLYIAKGRGGSPMIRSFVEILKQECEKA